MLVAWGQGEEAAMHQLMPLVNEAYLKLVDCQRVQWQDRAHFFAVSARLMRRILVDSARSRRSQKRGVEASIVSLDEASRYPRCRVET